MPESLPDLQQRREVIAGRNPQLGGPYLVCL